MALSEISVASAMLDLVQNFVFSDSDSCAENGNIFPAAFSLSFLLIYEIN